MAEGAMSAFLGENGIGAFFTQCITWLGNVLDVITQEPALLITVFGMFIVGFAVSLLGRLIRL